MATEAEASAEGEKTANTDTADTNQESQVVNPLAMSDEDFLKMGVNGAPPTVEAAAAAAEEPKTEDPKVETPASEGAGDPNAKAEQPSGESEAGAGDKPAADPAGSKPEGEAAAAPAKDGEKPAEGEAKPEDKPAEQTPPNYEAFYNQIMTPFKANGKTIELKSPDEAVRLMQMGANYTRKMQELVPHRKTLAMLENNGLLGEEAVDRLSFLIDLDKKNPEAIKKLIKDAGVDPMEIDTSVEPAYLEGNHRVTDEEVNFKSALDELSSTPTGKETLQDINTRWDQASKELLWKHPETLGLIHSQKEVGIYDRIAGEIDRRRTLGTLPATTPFLEAYKIVGDELTASNGFADLIAKAQGTAKAAPAEAPGQVPNQPAAEPVATRVAAPKPQVKNGDKVSAASPTRSTPTTAKAFVNPLAMSDDEFLKSFNGRL
jgi:hypothetical protein